jgi:flagellar biosynthesis/type III secretory pathway M-ring protein FliF/YscJ
MTKWMIAVAVVIVLIWAGFYLVAFVVDRRRNEDVEHDDERFEQPPDTDPQ